MRRKSNDWQLIRRYLDKHDVDAFEHLMKRHYDTVYSYVLARSPQQSEASYLTQRIWTAVVDQLDEFEPTMDFLRFLTDISHEIITEFQRAQASPPAIAPVETYSSTQPEVRPEPQVPVMESEGASHERFVSEQLRSLSCEERMIYLLKEVSDHPLSTGLSWERLADFNGIDSQDAWDRFELVRKLLLEKHHQDMGKKRLECLDLLIFLVWTQANRPSQNQIFSWHYYSDLTGMATLQLQMDYRSAEKKLAKASDNDDY